MIKEKKMQEKDRKIEETVTRPGNKSSTFTPRKHKLKDNKSPNLRVLNLKENQTAGKRRLKNPPIVF